MAEGLCQSMRPIQTLEKIHLPPLTALPLLVYIVTAVT